MDYRHLTMPNVSDSIQVEYEIQRECVRVISKIRETRALSYRLEAEDRATSVSIVSRLKPVLQTRFLH